MSESAIDRLQARVGEQFRAIAKARTDANNTLSGLSTVLASELKLASSDTSVVVFGSLARQEWTSKSDLDWTFLIDGQANADHLTTAQAIEQTLHTKGMKAPGPTGIFGNLAFSHQLIHNIGGQQDTNRNMTQRVLLLLESRPVAPASPLAYTRVITAVLNRYLEEETNLRDEKGTHYKVPRFLLNDVVRFWRTMAVDFASKQRDRAGKGWGLRNAKLRMSRKLIFAAGLLMCFYCNLTNPREISTGDEARREPLVNFLRELIGGTPLELLAKAMLDFKLPVRTCAQAFSSYDRFLSILDDESAREHLNALRAESARTDRLFGDIRKISSEFQEALDELFFNHAEISPLTRRYGIF